MTKILTGKYYYILLILWLIWAGLTIGAGKNLTGGWKYFVMDSDSMAPSIPKGSLVLVKQKENYQIGEVISFYAKVLDQEKIVAHRITALGGNTYITAGDQNEAEDAVPVLPRLIIGKVVGLIKFLGVPILVMKNENFRWLTVALPVILVIINELWKIKKELQNEPTNRR
ncbi:MAG: signal peptidase I [Candidatus Shapirobacteria bacterium]